MIRRDDEGDDRVRIDADSAEVEQAPDETSIMLEDAFSTLNS